ncbi:MAG: thermonuclease family protein [Candidatus Competibacteraceae bacterium]
MPLPYPTSGSNATALPDTLTLLVAGNQQVKVRLAGIDAPKLKQPYGQQAKQALSALIFGQEVKVDGSGPDKYGRTLGTVWVGTVNVNAEWVYRAYPFSPEPPASGGRCGEKRTCGEMTSCEEARFYLTQCRVSRAGWRQGWNVV